MLVLLLDDAIPLKGFYRIRPGQPGFAIPVFENNGQLVVQHIDMGGTYCLISEAIKRRIDGCASR
jgi:hypothetical protein